MTYKNVLNLLTITILLTLAVYHFFIFFGRKKESYYLFFALLGLALSSHIYFADILKNQPLSIVLVHVAIFFTISLSFLTVKQIIGFSKIVNIVFYICVIILFLITISSFPTLFLGRKWYYDNLLLICMVGTVIVGLTLIIATIVSIILTGHWKDPILVLIVLGLIVYAGNSILSGIANASNLRIIAFFKHNYILTGLFYFIFTISLALKFNGEYQLLQIKSRELLVLNQNLEQRVEERTAELRAAKDTIEQQERQKTVFFTNLMHHLKTPLSNIRTVIQNERFDDDLSVAVARLNAYELLTEMENYLVVEKYKNYGEYNYRHDTVVDLSPIVERVVECFSIYNIKSYIEPGLNVLINGEAFTRLLTCLLDNAVKYNRVGVNIVVKLKTENGRVLLSVKDDGVGIADSVQENIFNPFYQLANKESNSQGIGMGLNVVKMTVESAGGTVQVDSKVGEGATFTCTFPLSSEAATDFQPDVHDINTVDDKTLDARDSDYQHERDNILIVEDNRSLIFSLKEVLADYNIFTALNGRDGLRRLKKLNEENRYIDLILSDEMMDEMTGFEFIKRVKADERFAFIPFIFLTARTDFDDLLQGLQLGAVDYIKKPFAGEEVVARIRGQLEHKSLVAEEAVYSEEQLRYDSLKRVAKHFGLSGNGESYAIYATLGYSSREILEKLKMPVIKKDINKVNVTLTRVFKKVGVADRNELVKLFLEKEKEC